MSKVTKIDLDGNQQAPDTKQIGSYVHCQLCLEEIPANVAPMEWSQLEVGFTQWGLQVWCRRHECNVMHMDFEGQSPFPTTISRKPIERVNADHH